MRGARLEGAASSVPKFQGHDNACRSSFAQYVAPMEVNSIWKLDGVKPSSLTWLGIFEFRCHAAQIVEEDFHIA